MDLTTSYCRQHTSTKLRILCLHGRGTSADIFRSQTVSLREELSQQMIFYFLDGEWECEPYPMVDRFWPGPYRTHYDSGTGIGLSEAISRVLKFANANGPFDGIMGFSQGAALTAAVLARMHKIDASNSFFKFGILMCGGRPTEVGSNARWPSKRFYRPPRNSPSLSTSRLIEKTQLVTSHPPPKIRIPTAHFAGIRDPLYEETLALYSTADQESALLWEFDDGHTIPRNSMATAQMAAIIRKTARRASEDWE